jgi:outer membrane immunogenic protein
MHARILSGVAALIAVTTAPALAADMGLPLKAPPMAAAPYNWAGIYAGGHFGYLWGRTTVIDDGVVTERDAATDGAIGGVLLGVNWQNGRVVFGLEGDIGWTNAHGVGNGPIVLPPPTPNLYDINWTSHLGGRIGYAFDRLLVFGAGGLAIADINFTPESAPVAPGGTYYGWSIGGGAEYAFTQNFIGRIEYRYDDFGDKTYVLPSGSIYNLAVTGQTLRGAAIWKF